MKFKPFGNKYNFKQDVLLKTFPNYLFQPLNDWLFNLLDSVDLIGNGSNYLSGGRSYLKTNFLNRLQLFFHEVFPQYWKEAIEYIFYDQNRTANFLAFCLQNFARSDEANVLEYILSQGGSGYAVIKTQQDASDYDKGVYDLIERVDEIIIDESAKALEKNDSLKNAWINCYSRNPDYEKVVISCQNFLEQFLRDKYEPENKKPQLGKLIGNLKNAIQKLKFKGEDVLSDKKIILFLIDNIPQFRGIHTAGTGKIPSKEVAEFVLHTTIYIWNLHQK